MGWEVIRSMPTSGEPIRWRNGPFSRSAEMRPTVISKTLTMEAETVYEVRLPDGRRHQCDSLEDAKAFAVRQSSPSARRSVPGRRRSSKS
jgi:hypothetical protein